jgi:hypothetical protein
MANGRNWSLKSASIIVGAIGLSWLITAGAAAKPGGAYQDDNGYQITEQGTAQGTDHQQSQPTPGSASNTVGETKNDGPVRLARIAYVSGNVTWRTDENGQWSAVSINLPLREGAQISVTDGGRAEIQFDDGSVLRLGNGAIATLQTLYSDADGEFTEIKLNAGLASLRLRNSISVYQIDTPVASIKAAGPAAFRLGVDTGLEVAVRLGNVVIEGQQGKVNLVSGNYVDLRDAMAALNVRSLSDKDSWDLWNDERDEAIDFATRPAGKFLPSDIALAAGDIDDYGSWRNDATYGQVWCPRVPDANWRPYHDGHWTWVAPFGWTWVANEPWGWAPYHYGAWVYQPYGWAWVPGPAQQVWCPAVVHFSQYHGQIAWCALAPTEVRYPPVIAIGFHHGNWATLFSIGQAGVYYVSDRTYCVSRPFSNAYVNHGAAGMGFTNSIVASGNPVPNTSAGAVASRQFIPVNAVRAAGGSVATVAEFAGDARYGTLPKSSGVYFADGTSVDTPASGTTPMAGPLIIPPTPAALTPNRLYVRNSMLSAAMLQRSVIASPLPAQVQRTLSVSQPAKNPNNIQPVQTAANRTGIVTLPDAGRTASSAGGHNGSSAGERGAAERAAGARASLEATGSPTASGQSSAVANHSGGSDGRGAASPNAPQTGSGGASATPRQPQPQQPGPPPHASPPPEPQRSNPPPSGGSNTSGGRHG